MAGNHTMSNGVHSDTDNDPTADLEILPEAVQTSASVDADDTITRLRSELLPPAEALSELTFEVAKLRSHWDTLEIRIRALEQELATLNKLDTPAKAMAKNNATRSLPDNPVDNVTQAALLVPVDDHLMDEYLINQSSVILGSNVDSDVFIDTPFISRRHAQITSSKTGAILRDLDSTNGTYVNSKRIKRHALRHGDSITVGQCRFKYVHTTIRADDGMQAPDRKSNSGI